jgi:hypothetical protein
MEPNVAKSKFSGNSKVLQMELRSYTPRIGWTRLKDDDSGFEFDSSLRDIARGYEAFICYKEERCVCRVDAKRISNPGQQGPSTYEVSLAEIKASFEGYRDHYRNSIENSLRTFDEELPVILEGWRTMRSYRRADGALIQAIIKLVD